jgi:hypothetical protein
MPEVAAQLAPRHDDTRHLEVAERQRPDHALRRAPLLVRVGDRDIAKCARLAVEPTRSY